MQMQIDNKLDVIEKKIDQINDRLHATNITLAEQHMSLKEHMRRTELLEVGLESYKNIMKETLKPIEKHVLLVNWGVKFIVAVAAVAGFEKLAVFLRI